MAHPRYPGQAPSVVDSIMKVYEIITGKRPKPQPKEKITFRDIMKARYEEEKKETKLRESHKRNDNHKRMMKLLENID